MSSLNIEVESEEKKPRRGSWFDRRRRSVFSSSRRMWRYGSHKRSSDNASTSSGEESSTTSGEPSKAGDVVVTTIVASRGGSCRKSEGDGDAPESTTEMLECPLCLTTQAADNFPMLSTCHHRSCLTCLRQYLTIEITESRVNLMCPECQEKLHPTDMRSILDNNPHLLLKWEEFTLRRALSIDSDCRWCPAPDCGYAVIAHGCASCPRLVCQRPGCDTEFCYHCRQEWHPNQTCDAAHLQRTRQLRIRSNSAYSHRSSYHADEIKPCPKCGVLIVKLDDGSCNHITCSVCEADFCWLCLQEITDLHYLSPSGCTFWGKKRWSKKKKILWQLGLLIGAPLCIGLAAGIAVPAIMVALPIWVWRKVRSLLKHRGVSKVKRNIILATCLTFSAVLSPAVAALAIGIGVPVVLIYVYGVVPFSFCRSGGYGDQKPGASSMLPANFLFDLGGTSGQTGNSSPDEGTSFNGPPSRLVPTNPSIGEASVGGITMGSFNTSRGSNLDKIGRADLDVASTMAMAGTSITGSISGISAGGALTSRTDVIAKDLDQHSILTQVSVGSVPGVASVQVHMNDSDHSSSHPVVSGNAATRTSIKYPGGMRKARVGTKRSSSVKSIPPSKMESHGVHVVEDSLIISMTMDAPSPLTIVDETEASQSLELSEEPCTSSAI